MFFASPLFIFAMMMHLCNYASCITVTGRPWPKKNTAEAHACGHRV